MTKCAKSDSTLFQLVMEDPEEDANFEAFFADAPYLHYEEDEGAPPPFLLPAQCTRTGVGPAASHNGPVIRPWLPGHHPR